MKRIIIPVGERLGVLADITTALVNGGVGIEALNTEGAGDKHIIILTTEEYDLALRVLMNAGFKAVTDDALVIRLRDRPGTLAMAAEKFKQAGVNIQSLHILNRRDGYTTLALSSDNREKAAALFDSDDVV